MKSLEESRKEIDQIDHQILELFNKRLNVVDNIIQYKKDNNMRIEDPRRELFILQTLKIEYENCENKEELIALEKQMIDISKAYQKKKGHLEE